MKRRLLLLTCLMVLSFTGCNDSDKNNQEMEDTKPIEKEDVDDSEAAQVTTDTEQTIEVSDYFQEPRQIIELLDMEKAEPWQFPEGDSYAKDGFKLELYDNLFSFKNEAADSITLYGIKVGDTIEDAVKTVEDRGWKSYYTNDNEYAFLALVNNESYLLSLGYTGDGAVASWYVNNWPQGEDIDEVLKGEQSAEDVSSQSWKQPYIDYINGHNQFLSSKLININGDDIPELYIDYGVTAYGSVICSYANGRLIEQYLYVAGLSYIEGENLFRDTGGHMDVYYDKIYTIQDGQFVLLYSGNYGAENNADIQLDESGRPIYSYYWNGSQVSSEEEYMNLLNQVYNTDMAVSPYDGAEYSDGRYIGNGLCNYDEIIVAINSY